MAFALTPRSAGLTLAAALASAWLGTPSTERPVAEQSTRGTERARPRDSQDAVLRAEVLRHRPSPAPLPASGRNPFVFGTRTPRSTKPLADRSDAAIAPVVESLPPMPVFKLSGVASTAQDGATVLTAILNDNGAMVFAKAGDTLSNGYSVVRVEETSVTLVDSTGVTQTIRLP